MKHDYTGVLELFEKRWEGYGNAREAIIHALEFAIYASNLLPTVDGWPDGETFYRGTIENLKDFLEDSDEL